MPKILLITTIVAALVLLGVVTLYYSTHFRSGDTEQEDGKIKMDQGRTIVEKSSVQPKERVAQPEQPKEQPTLQPKEPTTTESIDTSDWKVYRDDKFGFTIKYPPNWYILENDPVAKKNEVLIRLSVSKIVVDIAPAPSPSSRSEVLSLSESIGCSFGAPTTIIIDGYRARKHTITCPDGSEGFLLEILDPPANWNEENFILFTEPEGDPLIKAVVDSIELSP